MPKMNPEAKAKWLEALRSGQYEQGVQNLRTLDNKHCCLGVLCELAVKAGVIEEPVPLYGEAYSYENGFTGGPGPRVEEWSGIFGLGRFNDGEKDTALAFINDEGATFSEIADIIEAEF